MTPTPEQLHVFRLAEEEAEFGTPLSKDDLTAAQIRTAYQLADLGYLTATDHDFEITSDGQLAFADCGR